MRAQVSLKLVLVTDSETAAGHAAPDREIYSAPAARVGVSEDVEA